MSRSNPNAGGAQHPCNRWFQWKGGEGEFSYWDPEAKSDSGDGKGARIICKLPYSFMFLDSTATVRGYSESREAGVIANEVRDTRAEELIVKWNDSKEVIAKGLWNDIKDKVGSKRINGNFCSKVYIAYKKGDALEIGCIEMAGCALAPWFDFQKRNRKAIMSGRVIITKGELEKSSEKSEKAVEWYPPVFKIGEVSPETSDAAIALDKILQEYFLSYFKRGDTDSQPAAPTDTRTDEEIETAQQEEVAAALEAARAAARDRKASTTKGGKPAAAIEEDPADDDVPF